MAKRFDEALLDLLKKAKPLGKAEQLALVAAAKTGDTKAREKLVHCWTAYIVRRASFYCKYSQVPIEDLYQIGVIGMLEAIATFDLARTGATGEPIAFSTYAPWKINQRMIEEADTRSFVVRIPAKTLRKNRQSIADAVAVVTKGIVSIETGPYYGTRYSDEEHGHKETEVHFDKSLCFDPREDDKDGHARVLDDLLEAVAKLPDAMTRKCVELYLAGWKKGAIADFLGIGEKRHKTLMENGLQQLRQIVMEQR